MRQVQERILCDYYSRRLLQRRLRYNTHRARAPLRYFTSYDKSGTGLYGGPRW